MSKNDLFFIANPRLQKMWRNNQVLIGGKVVCGELHAGEHIVVYEGNDWSEKMLCRAIIKQSKKVTTAWAGELVFLVLPREGKKILFAAALELKMSLMLVLLAEVPSSQIHCWKQTQKVKLVVPDYFRFEVWAEITDLVQTSDNLWKITLHLQNRLFLNLNQTVEIFAHGKHLLGHVADLEI